MSSSVRSIDPSHALDALAFQSDLLALSTALETVPGDTIPPDFAAVKTELRRLAQAARETAQSLRDASPSAPLE